MRSAARIGGVGLQRAHLLVGHRVARCRARRGARSTGSPRRRRSRDLPRPGARPCRRRAGRPWRRGGSSGAPCRSSSRSARCGAATPRCRRARSGTPGNACARRLRVDDAWRDSGRSSVRPPGEYWSSPRIFFCAVSLLSIESRLPARDADEEPRAPDARRRSLGRVPVAAARSMPDPEAAPLEEARDQHRAEGGVIDVGVAGDDEDVEPSQPRSERSAWLIGRKRGATEEPYRREVPLRNRGRSAPRRYHQNRPPMPPPTYQPERLLALVSSVSEPPPRVSENHW